MKGKIILTMAAIALLGGCATGFHRGVVAMKIDDSTAHVGLNRDEAKVGYKSAVDRGTSFEYYGDWMKKAREGLRQVDPTYASKDSGEMHADSRLTDWMGL